MEDKILDKNILEEVNEEDISRHYKPFEIDCILVEKVYDACRQQECQFFEFPWYLPNGWDEEDVAYGFAKIVPSSVTYEVIDKELIDGAPLARVQVEVCAQIEMYVVNQQGVKVKVIPPTNNNNNLIKNKVCFEKDVILYMPDLEKMKVIVEAIFQVAGEPILEFPEEGPALAFIPIGAFIILKSVAKVQLLVPTFGFCPLPPLCEEFPDTDPCDDFQQLPFPDFYPPQPPKNK
ncbi:hypothetical protein SAMN02745227_02172 [Anaerobranca californiensis DSM 14826]|jgi:hypothetical protein|uniref:SipL SPOCS domain-containing protein n=1 Tax=Anaerobranca californiensis DSM 14826 TaxID=1120989 RepID=A0A1M6S5B0_9FIRM|nr:hypothetical protein [Anaerobranca californiensis]SHK39895.1 hypothetical protein SAMN02745227_02172 [Anaerobranca californiensis DSM 14826]